MNIKENLLEMKNMTELMLDLAYSAIFLKDKGIAERIKEMHNEVSLLEEETYKILFRVKEPEDVRMFIVDLTDSMKDIANAALHMAELAEDRMPSIISDMLTESNERVISARVSAKSAYANRTIGENEIRTRTHVHIIGIKRKGIWLFNINKDMKLMPEDEIIAVGKRNADKVFRKVASG